MNEKIFNLDDPQYISYNRKKQDYLKIAPTTGTAGNLNTGGNAISFEVNNQANYLFLPDAFVYCEFQISNAAASAVPGNITLENNWFPRIFDEMRLEIGSQQLEIINEPGEFDTMLKFVTRKQDYSKANIEGWIPDTNDGGAVVDITGATAITDAGTNLAATKLLATRANTHNLNTGFLKRKQIYNNANGVTNRNGFIIKWPLSPLFGYLDHRKVSVNLPIKLQLTRKANDTAILFGADGQNGKLEVVKMELWIPNIQPSLDIETKVLSRLKTNKDIKVTYLKRNTFSTTITQQEYTWQVANISNQPRYLFLAFKPTEKHKAFTVNNSLYVSYQGAGTGVTNAVQITDLQVKLNQTRYPLDPIKLNAAHYNIFEAYNSYEEICKGFGAEPQLDPIDYRNLYPIYCFDLSAQDENLVKNGVNIQISIKKSHAESLTAYCLILEDTSHVIKVIGGQMSRIE